MSPGLDFPAEFLRSHAELVKLGRYEDVVRNFIKISRDHPFVAGRLGGIQSIEDLAAGTRAEVVARRIAEAVQNSTTQPLMLPQKAQEALISGVRPPSGIKVLLALPEHIGYSPANIKFEVPLYLKRAADNAGVECIVYNTDAIQNPVHKEDGTYSAHLQRFYDFADALRPDVIIFEGQDGMHVPFPENFLTVARNNIGGKWVHLHCDFYGAAFSRVQSWAAVADRGVVFDTRTVPEPVLDQYKLLAMHVPVETFGRPAQTRQGVTFCGQANKHLRALWLAVVGLLDESANIVLTDRVANTSLDLDQMHSAYGSAEAVINLTSRNTEVSIITGRAWEAISNQTLLLEEANQSFSDFFTPYRDYIPFSTVPELAGALRFMRDRKDLVDAVVRNASNMMRDHYNDMTFWGRLLSAL